MIYQTYSALATTPIQLHRMKPVTINLTGIGDIKCTPMSNFDIWAGAVILCTWDKEPINQNPKAMYLSDSEGEVYQFHGTVDYLMREGVVYDLTTPYSHILNVAEQVLIIIVNQNDAIQWWNEYIEYAITMNIQSSDLIKYALSLSEKYCWPDAILNQIKNIKVKSLLSPIHRVKRLHYLVAEREHRIVQHID